MKANLRSAVSLAGPMPIPNPSAFLVPDPRRPCGKTYLRVARQSSGAADASRFVDSTIVTLRAAQGGDRSRT